MARLLAAIPVESAAGLRLRALVLAYLLTGRRRSEVLNLRWHLRIPTQSERSFRLNPNGVPTFSNTPVRRLL